MQNSFKTSVQYDTTYSRRTKWFEHGPGGERHGQTEMVRYNMLSAQKIAIPFILNNNT